jgi:hypothetical protein
MIVEWLLITHIVCLFPIGSLLWNYKVRKEKDSLFLITRFLYTLFFSLMYHSYHITDKTFINLHEDYRDTWGFFDSHQSASLVISTILYCCRIREPWVYIVSYFIDTFLLVINFFNLYIITIYLLTIVIFIVFIFKYKTIIRFFKFFRIISIGCVSCCGISVFCYYSSDDDTHYVLYHSLWHVFIFTSAGLGIILRYKLNNKLYPVRTRETLNSL